MLLPLEEAIAQMLADTEPLGIERVGLDAADGRVLRQDLHAGTDLPAFDHSAMDGYALHSSWCHGDGPWTLKVSGESRAGQPLDALQDGHACRIFTGARMPAGADCVLLQENVTRTDDAITFTHRSTAGEHLRRAGTDMKRGELALAAGTRLDPGHIGLLAALDHAFAVVARPARVTIISTGDELRLPSQPGPVGSIAESNSFTLAALCRRLGAQPQVLPHVSDEPEATERALDEALGCSDVVVTAGGASKGDHDLVLPALGRCGAHMLFAGVAVKPGKPVAYGRRGSARVLCLPGNPASAVVTFTLFGAPLLRALHGQQPARVPREHMSIEGERRRKTGRTELLRARLDVRDGQPHAVLIRTQSSGAVTAFAQSQALVEVAADMAEVHSGQHLPVLRLADAWR